MTSRHVVATAGHVDHGKSTLVRALTGMEPDRFAEERRRGLTIDLGFAWTTLPSGAHVAFVDVPGHQRFIANMLTGIGPAPAVLFVVAADEGWRRQSAEHLAAIDALQVRSGLLALTRCDLVSDPDALAAAELDALDHIGRSSLGAVASVRVSGRTGVGVAELRVALDELVTATPRPDRRAPIRLWLDRSFSIRGAGTVVTGTLGAGTLRVGDTLELSGRTGRTVVVRGLQSAGETHEHVTGTARVALNLRGIAADDIGRGDVLVSPAVWYRTRNLDVRLSTDAPIPEQLVLHVGTASVPVRLRPLGRAHARLTLAAALPLRAGDRAVLRDPGRHSVAAGVLVLDADPPALARRGAAARRADVLAGMDGAPDATVEIARRGMVRRDHLARLGIDTSGLADVAGWLIDSDVRRKRAAHAQQVVRDWALAHPLDPRMPVAAFARTLELPDELVPAVVRDASLRAAGGRVFVPDETAGLGPAQPAVDALVTRLRAAPFRAPEHDELHELGLGHRELAAAVRAGALLRLDDVVLLPDAANRAVDALRSLTPPFTLSQARQALDTTRRVAVPLLEHLDAIGRTRFVDGTRRVVVESSSGQDG